MKINQLQVIISTYFKSTWVGKLLKIFVLPWGSCKIQNQKKNENRIAEYFQKKNLPAPKINDLNLHVLPRRSHNSKASLTCGNLHPPRFFQNGRTEGFSGCISNEQCSKPWWHSIPRGIGFLLHLDISRIYKMKVAKRASLLATSFFTLPTWTAAPDVGTDLYLDDARCLGNTERKSQQTYGCFQK